VPRLTHACCSRNCRKKRRLSPSLIYFDLSWTWSIASRTTRRTSRMPTASWQCQFAVSNRLATNVTCQWRICSWRFISHDKQRFCGIFCGIYLSNIVKETQQWRFWTATTAFRYNQRSCWREDSASVRKAHFLCLRSENLEPGSFTHQKHWIYSGFSQSSQKLPVYLFMTF